MQVLILNLYAVPSNKNILNQLARICSYQAKFASHRLLRTPKTILSANATSNWLKNNNNLTNRIENMTINTCRRSNQSSPRPQNQDLSLNVEANAQERMKEKVLPSSISGARMRFLTTKLRANRRTYSSNTLVKVCFLKKSKNHCKNSKKAKNSKNKRKKSHLPNRHLLKLKRQKKRKSQFLLHPHLSQRVKVAQAPQNLNLNHRPRHQVTRSLSKRSIFWPKPVASNQKFHKAIIQVVPKKAPLIFSFKKRLTL